MMRIVNLIVEILTSPFSFIMKANMSPSASNKWGKPLIILFIALCIVVILILYFYRDYIFK